ncbi:hypothetical protein CLIM01_03211 [Colletotrichum limetticola]|uniref:Uncharacterized protein n=1 Tax=Colletotrichum limetticola TaxID=1209924 RepID=A0ABQ9Q6I2_9PEZI|nr:hypothetical protein CLIM01_03211 [Colletotrichum limetticola]
MPQLDIPTGGLQETTVHTHPSRGNPPSSSMVFALLNGPQVEGSDRPEPGVSGFADVSSFLWFPLTSNKSTRLASQGLSLQQMRADWPRGPQGDGQIPSCGIV